MGAVKLAIAATAAMFALMRADAAAQGARREDARLRGLETAWFLGIVANAPTSERCRIDARGLERRAIFVANQVRFRLLTWAEDADNLDRRSAEHSQLLAELRTVDTGTEREAQINARLDELERLTQRETAKPTLIIAGDTMLANGICFVSYSLAISAPIVPTTVRFNNTRWQNSVEVWRTGFMGWSTPDRFQDYVERGAEDMMREFLNAWVVANR